jgi:hypothetical protein
MAARHRRIQALPPRTESDGAPQQPIFSPQQSNFEAAASSLM